MKKMFYIPERIFEILAEGEKDGCRYLVVSYGTHPCGYVGVRKNHVLYGKDYTDDGFPDIAVHGGITFSEGNVHEVDDGRWWIGWDYNHYGDYSANDNLFRRFLGEGDLTSLDDVRHRTEEIVADCLDVIEQLGHAQINLLNVIE